MGFTARAPFEELSTLERHRRALDARMLECLGELDESWPQDPAVPDLASELAFRLGINATSAWDRLRIAKALRVLPHIARAHGEGRLSWDQLRWVSRFATSETDMEWSERAPGMRPDALRLESYRQKVVRSRDSEADHALRSASMRWDEEGRFFELYARLAAEQGAAAEAALNEAAQQVPADEEAEDHRGARLADALVGRITSSGARSAAPTLVVHADAEIVAGVADGEQHISETSGGTQLSRQAVRRLACDAKVVWTLERNGSPVGVVSKSRRVTERQMEALMFRDRGCMFPGCGSRWFLHAHHIRHWTDGGKTELANLTLLCGSHHRRLHDGGWTIRGRPPDSLEFISRNGYVFGRAGPELARAG
ncbi:MAG: DUF222 domain-containing protein [Actinomycetota bacterium]